MNGYVALEGVNGVGKSIIIEELKRRVNTLREDQPSIHFTREVGGCPEAERIRDFLTSKKHLSPQGKEALIWTARTQLARFLDRNHKGSTVISDRCWVSTFVYNSTSLESTLERVEVLRRSYPTPDVYVLLDAPVEEIIKRQNERCKLTGKGSGVARVDTPFDKTEVDELSKAIGLYRGIFETPPKSLPGKWVTVDTTRGVEAVVEEIFNLIVTSAL